jgi:hypothetical protein
MEHLSAWVNFYVIIGTAAATLIGLMFVVITISSQFRLPGSSDALGAFNTPNIVHFVSALGVAVLLSAPWPLLWEPLLLLALVGVAGLGYMYVVVRRMHRQQSYMPVLEDRIFHVLLPSSAYGAFIVTALVGAANITPALFMVGAAAVLFLFIGIHNTWDGVTYVVFTLRPADERIDATDHD